MSMFSMKKDQVTVACTDVPGVPGVGRCCLQEVELSDKVLNEQCKPIILMFCWPCIISEISPTRCTILLNIYIYFSSLHVSGIHVPIIRRKLLYLCDTGICHSVWVATGLLIGFSIQPTDQTPPIQSDKYQCRIGTVIFSWWCAHGCPKHVEKRNKYIYSAELCT